MRCKVRYSVCTTRGGNRTIRDMIETKSRGATLRHRGALAGAVRYSVTQLPGVRCQADQRNVVSLWRLLDQLVRHPSIATRARLSVATVTGIRHVSPDAK